MSKPDSSLQTIAAQVLKTSKIDEQAAAKLLLLGMMNKSLRLPYAVVKPRQQEVAKDKRNGKELTKIVPVEARGIKRKAEDADDVCDEGDKKEKRRKMNRVSAQNSRDRKKQYVTDLEKRLKYLEDKNKELAQENKLLQERSCVLEEEKRELASRLANCGKEQAAPQRIEAETHFSYPPQPVDVSESDLLACLCEGLAAPEPSSPSFAPVSSLPTPPSSLYSPGAASPQSEHMVGSSTTFLEPSNELNLFDPMYSSSPALSSTTSSHSVSNNPLADGSLLPDDAELDKLLQSFVVPESFNNKDSTIAAWDVDQLLSSDHLDLFS